MRTVLRALLILALMTSVPELFAAIAFVNENTTANANTTDCSATQGTNFVTGNVLIVMVAIRTTTSTVSTVTAGTDTLLKFGAANNSTNARMEVWVDASYAGGTAAKATVTLGASSKCVGSVAEYSGVSAIGHIKSATQASANPVVSLTTQDANDWLVVGDAGQGNGTFTAGTGCGTTTGNLRGSGVSGGGSGSTQVGGALCDNSNVSATSISETATNADTIWQMIGLELRSSSTIGFIQSNEGSGGSYTFPFSNRAGDLIVECDNRSASGTPTDTPSNTYAVASAFFTSGTAPARTQCWYAANIAVSTANTVTAGASGTAYIAEFSNAATSTPIDVSSSGGNTTTSLTSGSASINFTNELIIGFFSGVTADTYTSGSGFTGADIQAANAQWFEWKTVSSCASYAATATDGTTPNALGLSATMATFKDTGASSCSAATCAHTLSLLGAGCS